MAKCIGTYPKWFAYTLRWLFKRSKGCNVRFIFRGRGHRHGSFNYTLGLPLKYSPRVAIYIK